MTLYTSSPIHFLINDTIVVFVPLNPFNSYDYQLLFKLYTKNTLVYTI